MRSETVDILKALADQTRLDIVRTLVKKKNDTASCNEVSTCSSLSQPTMSHHFNKLVDAGVVLEKKVGTEKIYELNIAALENAGINPEKL